MLVVATFQASISRVARRLYAWSFRLRVALALLCLAKRVLAAGPEDGVINGMPANDPLHSWAGSIAVKPGANMLVYYGHGAFDGGILLEDHTWGGVDAVIERVGPHIREGTSLVMASCKTGAIYPDPLLTREQRYFFGLLRRQVPVLRHSLGQQLAWKLQTDVTAPVENILPGSLNAMELNNMGYHRVPEWGGWAVFHPDKEPTYGHPAPLRGNLVPRYWNVDATGKGSWRTYPMSPEDWRLWKVEGTRPWGDTIKVIRDSGGNAIRWYRVSETETLGVGALRGGVPFGLFAVETGLYGVAAMAADLVAEPLFEHGKQNSTNTSGMGANVGATFLSAFSGNIGRIKDALDDPYCHQNNALRASGEQAFEDAYRAEHHGRYPQDDQAASQAYNRGLILRALAGQGSSEPLRGPYEVY